MKTPGTSTHCRRVVSLCLVALGGLTAVQAPHAAEGAATAGSSALKVLSGTKLFSLAESLGGVESLIGHPASMTHASIPREERVKNGLVDSLIRLSVGIEDVEDLIEDLKQAIG